MANSGVDNDGSMGLLQHQVVRVEAGGGVVLTAGLCMPLSPSSVHSGRWAVAAPTTIIGDTAIRGKLQLLGLKVLGLGA